VRSAWSNRATLTRTYGLTQCVVAVVESEDAMTCPIGFVCQGDVFLERISNAASRTEVPESRRGSLTYTFIFEKTAGHNRGGIREPIIAANTGIRTWAREGNELAFEYSYWALL